MFHINVISPYPFIMMRSLRRVVLIGILVLAAVTTAGAQATLESGTDRAAVEIDALIERYRSDADEIIEAAMRDSSTWDRLAYVTDTFGPRFSGSQALEDAIDWIMDEMNADGLENVHGEKVMVPHWVRGDERLVLLEPHERELHVLGLGGSVGTGPGGVEGEVLVVNSFDDLAENADRAEGRIVLWNVEFTSYGNTVRYRSEGAIQAAEAGATASLVRSVGPFSLYTPHTGNSRYADDVPRIPHAAVTVEDAMMMQRMQDRGQTIRVQLEMNALQLPDAESRNVVAELRGTEFPDEVVVLGGHIDSWDQGTGAMDDAGGCVAAWDAVKLLHELGMRPKRTIRVVMWTNEENGLRGANAYRDEHLDALDDHVLAMESDSGIFDVQGFGFSGSDAAYDVISGIGRLLEPIEAGTIRRGGGGADIGPIMAEGVPGMGLNVDGSRYFWYHHTKADYVSMIDPGHLNEAVAAMAVMAYVVADMDQKLPR